MKEIVLETNLSKSVIRCGSGAFDAYAKKYAQGQIYIVTDSNVFAIYRHLLWETFGNSFPVTILPAGESSKTYNYLISILKDMLSAGMRRNCTVIAFGGGVVGDVAGLAASLYMRGVNLVQIPTTLLAQVDSSVGGKTAVDVNGVKNVIGTFYQPAEVIADPRFLQTLTARELRCGLGEIVKYGALDGGILNKLLNNCDSLYKWEFLEDLIYDCIRYKANVVAQDEREIEGKRKILNLGHTTGHAFELFYRKKSHGEFVLIGMYYELYIAVKRGICGGQYADEIKKLILRVIKKVPSYQDVESAARYALYDKKNLSDKVDLIVPKSIGESAEIEIEFDEYANLLRECADTL